MFQSTCHPLSALSLLSISPLAGVSGFFSLLLVSSQHEWLSPTERGFLLSLHTPRRVSSCYIPPLSLKPSLLFISAFPFFFYHSLLSIIFPFAPSSRWETASLCKYLLFMNMPSLSTLHRCGHGTDEMLIVAW